MEDKIVPIYLEKNIGGAGGFNKGIRYAYEQGYDYIWVMDDDTITNETSLVNLVNKLTFLNEKNIGFICSNVLYKDNKPCIMNVPKVSKHWNEMASYGLIELESASFVSVLVSRVAVESVGLPIKEFFIWGDDIEFTRRISRKFKGFMAVDSVVHHYMKENKGTDLAREDKERINRYIYDIRNKFYISKKEGLLSFLDYLKFVLITITKIITRTNRCKIKKINIVIKGFFKGTFFNPKIEYLNEDYKKVIR
jgi:GT2 family glycosyltransferase